jgi:hypothetical protein
MLGRLSLSGDSSTGIGQASVQGVRKTVQFATGWINQATRHSGHDVVIRFLALSRESVLKCPATWSFIARSPGITSRHDAVVWLTRSRPENKATASLRCPHLSAKTIRTRQTDRGMLRAVVILRGWHAVGRTGNFQRNGDVFNTKHSKIHAKQRVRQCARVSDLNAFCRRERSF